MYELLLKALFGSLVLMVIGAAFGAERLMFYVSPDGKDGWSGRLTAPDAAGADGPFATLARARDAARELKHDGKLQQPVDVLIRGGIHFLHEPLALAPEDSGTAECPITYGAYNGERPVASGGRRITGWKQSTVNGKPCLSADLPDVAAGEWYFKQLFVGGVRRPRTRLPSTPLPTLGEGAGGGDGGGGGGGDGAGARLFRFTDAEPSSGQPWDNKGPKSAKFAPGDLKPWRNLADVEITVLQHWVEKHMRIAGVDEATRTVTFVAPGSNLKDEKGQFSRYCVENVFEALDTPGQWYLDRPAGKLYYLPLPGEDAATLDAIAPRLDCLVRLQGAKHVRMENLAFCHSEWSLPPDNPGSYQAASNVPGAIILDGAEDCTIYACRVSQVSQYAIQVLKGCARNRVIACTLDDLGAGGVKIERDSERTTVSDCTIAEAGRIFHSAVGVFIADSGRNRIIHNHIHDLFYTGISCGWTWGYRPTQTIDNRIEFNHIHDIGKGLLSDMGGIYTLGTQSGGVIRGNVIHDVTKYGYGGWGIYNDEGTSEMLVEGNLTFRTATPGYNMHYGKDVLVRNNVFAFARETQIGRGRQEQHRSFVYEGNILCWSEGRMFDGYQNDPHWGHIGFRRNVYWLSTGAPVSFNGIPMPDWQALGNDRDSIVADPLFVNAEKLDFRLRAESPALKMGFQQIDASLAGPRLEGKRPEHVDDWPAENERPAVIVQSRIEFIIPPVFVKDAKPGRVRLTVKNLGETHAAGEVAVLVSPPGAGETRGNRTLAFSLDPGKEASGEFDVVASPDAKEIAVETIPSGDAVIPTCIYAETGGSAR